MQLHLMEQSAAPSLVRLTVLPGQRDAPVPPWVHALAVPAWVTAPDGTIAYLNEQAEALLGVARGQGLGLPCHRVVASRDGQGRPFCRPGCRMAARAVQGDPLEPVELEVGPDGERRWARWLVIPVTADDGGTWLVHAVHDIEREHRATAYVERLSRRSAALRAIEPADDTTRLSPRETEILGLLEEDEDLGRIAARLGISHTTVRNHVQRLLGKLGAHSVQEAVALHVLA